MRPGKPIHQSDVALADRVYYCQLHVFQVSFLVFCALPCLLLALYLSPAIATLMGSGPQRSSMMVLKLLMLAPLLLVFLLLACVAELLAALINVPVVRLRVRELRGAQARAVLLQFYSDPRWLNPGHGSRPFPWWFSLWAALARHKRLLRWSAQLTAASSRVVYGTDTVRRDD